MGDAIFVPYKLRYVHKQLQKSMNHLNYNCTVFITCQWYAMVSRSAVLVQTSRKDWSARPPRWRPRRHLLLSACPRREKNFLLTCTKQFCWGPVRQQGCLASKTQNFRIIAVIFLPPSPPPPQLSFSSGTSDRARFVWRKINNGLTPTVILPPRWQRWEMGVERWRNTSLMMYMI